MSGAYYARSQLSTLAAKSRQGHFLSCLSACANVFYIRNEIYECANFYEPDVFIDHSKPQEETECWDFILRRFAMSYENEPEHYHQKVFTEDATRKLIASLKHAVLTQHRNVLRSTIHTIQDGIFPISSETARQLASVYRSLWYWSNYKKGTLQPRSPEQLYPRFKRRIPLPWFVKPMYIFHLDEDNQKEPLWKLLDETEDCENHVISLLNTKDWKQIYEGIVEHYNILQKYFEVLKEILKERPSEAVCTPLDDLESDMQELHCPSCPAKLTLQSSLNQHHEPLSVNFRELYTIFESDEESTEMPSSNAEPDLTAEVDTTPNVDSSQVPLQIEVDVHDGQHDVMTDKLSEDDFEYTEPSYSIPISNSTPKPESVPTSNYEITDDCYEPDEKHQAYFLAPEPTTSSNTNKDRSQSRSIMLMKRIGNSKALKKVKDLTITAAFTRPRGSVIFNRHRKLRGVDLTQQYEVDKNYLTYHPLHHPLQEAGCDTEVDPNNDNISQYESLTNAKTFSDTLETTRKFSLVSHASMSESKHATIANGRLRGRVTSWLHEMEEATRHPYNTNTEASNEASSFASESQQLVRATPFAKLIGGARQVLKSFTSRH